MSLHFELSEEHQLVEKTVRDAMQPWVARRAELREMTKRAEMPEELWKTFAELGLLGCLIPEEFGGNGMGLVAQALGFESVTAAGLSPNVLLVNCMDAACATGEAESGPLWLQFDRSVKLAFRVPPSVLTAACYCTEHWMTPLACPTCWRI